MGSYTLAVSEPGESSQRTERRPAPRAPWLALALLVLGAFLFWVMPLILGDRPVQVEFSPQESQKR